jgi:hypothetical protein
MKAHGKKRASNNKKGRCLPIKMTSAIFFAQNHLKKASIKDEQSVRPLFRKILETTFF